MYSLKCNERENIWRTLHPPDSEPNLLFTQFWYQKKLMAYYFYSSSRHNHFPETSCLFTFIYIYTFFLLYFIFTVY